MRDGSEIRELSLYRVNHRPNISIKTPKGEVNRDVAACRNNADDSDSSN